MSDEIVEFIATNVTQSVRDLEGVLASLLAYATLADCEIDMKLTEQVLGRIVELRPKHISMGDVLGAVGEHFNVQEKTIIAQTRTREVMIARHVAIYLAKELTDFSLAEIGNYLGHRTHATILHSFNLMKNQLSTDPVLRHQVNQIQSVLMR
jgi:chromosomal replication initiator protein